MSFSDSGVAVRGWFTARQLAEMYELNADTLRHALSRFAEKHRGCFREVRDPRRNGRYLYNLEEVQPVIDRLLEKKGKRRPEAE